MRVLTFNIKAALILEHMQFQMAHQLVNVTYSDAPWPHENRLQNWCELFCTGLAPAGWLDQAQVNLLMFTMALLT